MKHVEIRDKEGNLIRRVPDYAALHSRVAVDFEKVNWDSHDQRDMRDPQTLGRQILETIAHPEFPEKTATEVADMLNTIR